jgi:Lrp/AsnC family leucine-responsive transcriptional regulator
MLLDQTDMAILKLLQVNSRLQWKQIGEKVHLTGQAVAARVEAMQDSGVIQCFTICLDAAKLGKPVTAFITVFMNNARHEPFHRFIQQQDYITQAHRISGEGCYWLAACLASPEQLSQLLTTLLEFGNYRVAISLDQIK